MKITMLAASLVVAASPAISGPLMDGLLGGTSYKAASETILDGVEVYEGFEVAKQDERIVSALVKTYERDGLVHLEITGTEFFSQGAVIGGLETLQASFDPGIRDAMKEIYLEGPEHALLSGLIDRQDCTELDLPVSFSMEGLIFDEKRNGRLEIDKLNMSYKLGDPRNDCVVEFSFNVDDLKAAGRDSSLISVESINIGGRGSVLTEEAPTHVDDVYTARAELNGVSISMGGIEQMRIDQVMSDTQHDASITAALVDTGYFAAVNALTTSNGAAPVKQIIPMSKVAEIWNALRQGDGRNIVVIKGAEITGQIPQVVTGLPILSVGRSLDVEIRSTKTDDAVEANVDIGSEGLADIRFALATRMTKLDPGMGDVHPSAMMMSAPVSITGFGLEFIDEGLGDFTSSLAGFDLYTDLPAMAESMVGPQKAEKISKWLLGAKNGGAYFSAAPNTPLPVMQAFVGFMGDWSAFGEMINAKSSLQ